MNRMILGAVVFWAGSLSSAGAAGFSVGGSSTTKRMMGDLEQTSKLGNNY